MILPDLLYQVVSVECFTIIDDKFIKQTTRPLDNLMDDSSSINHDHTGVDFIKHCKINEILHIIITPLLNFCAFAGNNKSKVCVVKSRDINWEMNS